MPAKPTILAFHGSGSNATIHTVQLARLTRFLKPHFEIVSVEAPFPSAAGPGVLPFFEGCGPYKRWVPPTEKLTLEAMKTGAANPAMPSAVETLLRSTVSAATSSGSKVVGVIGFSQGTRVVAGLVKGKEIVEALGGDVGPEALWLKDLRFAVSMCGSYPPPLVPVAATEALERSAALGEEAKKGVLEGKIAVPTLHVQGKQDEWEWAGKLLIDGVYEVGEGKSTVFEFDMGHHYPVQAEDTERVAEWVLSTWKDSEEK